MKQCNITVRQMFQSLYRQEAMQYYRTANSSSLCTDMKQCRITVLQKFQSLYGHEAMQYYRTANSSSPCTDMKQCNYTVLQTVTVPVRTWSNVILPYCKQFLSLYGHEAMQLYRTANRTHPCTDMKQCNIIVLQKVPVPVRIWSNALLPYCKQFQSL